MSEIPKGYVKITVDCKEMGLTHEEFIIYGKETLKQLIVRVINRYVYKTCKRLESDVINDVTDYHTWFYFKDIYTSEAFNPRGITEFTVCELPESVEMIECSPWYITVGIPVEKLIKWIASMSPQAQSTQDRQKKLE